MGNYREVRQASRVVVSVFIAIALVYAVYFLPLPLYIFSAGTAETIQPMVQTHQTGAQERGTFMLTTVRVSSASVFSYLLSLVQPYDELRSKGELLRDNESEQEYTQRQEVSMLTSQSSAIEAAYHKLGIPYHIRNDGVVVMQLFRDFPAYEVLRPGDSIVQVDDTPVRRTEELLELLKERQAGDAVKIDYKRGDEMHSAEIKLAVLPTADGTTGEQQRAPRAGLGIVSVNVQSIQADDPKHQVTITAGEIGGPSAGLMFALEIVNRLTPEDITKGYKIAGTGTIDAQGEVGVIGGIQHKIIAADKAGAEIFFAPKDYTAPNGQIIPNFSAAEERAKDIQSRMKVVPVGTIDDALQYLSVLPPKAAANG
ncbi:SepM family pheromone-processing serine protease [Paenibacillus xerothermodurans]|uniref:endopeptidase La n=1 Tax=Paenibacillus xerothermodurans TaxID=1977292 RepID=A0A2W1NDA9_PAEXE|nr:SepM family pheromone-processing serine protease [Paenibacillus xerothermodurans]PZE22497.1 PDZ domain-containing protein [Paenibacillus xerothermodurans]